MPIYSELRSKCHLKDVKARVAKSVGAFSNKIGNLNSHIQRIMLCAYIRSIYEYMLPPLLMAGDLDLEKAIGWERKSIKSFLRLPMNSTEESIVKLLALNIPKSLLDRMQLIHKRINELAPIWAKVQSRDCIDKAMNKARKIYQKYASKIEYASADMFLNNSFTINERTVSGKEMAKKIYRQCSAQLPNPRKLNSLLFKSMWIKAKTGERQTCSKCNIVWGVKHILTCPHLKEYREIIVQWRTHGYMRVELYVNRSQIKYEASRLKEALQIIERLTITRPAAIKQ